MSGGDLPQFMGRNEHVTEVNRIFAKIKNSSTPTLLFIDEIESLARKRGDNPDQKLLELFNAFLNHTGDASKKFMIIGATNKPDLIDEAFLSRMDYKIEVQPPGVEEREKILAQNIERFFINKIHPFTSEKIRKIAENTEGLTGRALFKIVNALYAKMISTEHQILSESAIDQTVNDFVVQEESVKKR